MYRNKKTFLFAMILFVTVFITACSSSNAAFQAEQYISSIEDINIPEHVKLIALGEATHGNVELQELKKDVFEALIKNHNVRVFVLEADFGGGQQINQFILDGKGTAEAAVATLDYSIYNTMQMIELVQWMRDYNQNVSEEEKVYFYGNDMQRYDYSKQGLLDFYQMVNKDKAKKYEDNLKPATNATMRELSTKQLQEIEATLEQIILDLQMNELDYQKKSSNDAFAFALQNANIMTQRTQLFLNESDYTHLRDQYLAANLEWIVDYEAERGHGMVFFAGHNGHVEKTSANAAGYKSMGDYLDETYGENYFAIGTELMNSEFQALNSGTGKRENHKIKHKNDLVEVFREVEQNIFYLDFEKASESEELTKLINSKQRMLNVGDDFMSLYKTLKMFYTIKMVPVDAYDGVIFVKNATPTTVIE